VLVGGVMTVGVVVVVVVVVVAVDPGVVVEVEVDVEVEEEDEMVVVDELELVLVVDETEQPASTWSTSLGFGNAGVGSSAASPAPSVGTGSVAGISNGIVTPPGNSAVTHCWATAVSAGTVAVVLADAAGTADTPTRTNAVISIANAVCAQRRPVIVSVRLCASAGLYPRHRDGPPKPARPSRYLPPRRFAKRNHIPAYCTACSAHVNANSGRM
jgi:hypothetical protein